MYETRAARVTALAARFFCHQMVSTFEARILPSRVTNGSSSARAVAAMMRSGMSGTAARGIWRRAVEMSVVRSTGSSAVPAGRI